MGDLIDTTEMYLRTILELEEEGVPALRARIAERLGHSGPTVSQTVARMERDGLVRLSPERSLDLTASGRAAALRVMRKHRLAEVLLVDVVGVPLAEVHDEACRWEHVISDPVERRIDELLGHPTASPFGNPIPPAAEGGPGPRGADGMPASSVVGSERRRVVRVAERVQGDHRLMARLEEAGIGVGASISVLSAGAEGVTVVGPTGTAVLPVDGAAAVFVAERPEG
jgi:DtxR family Mn-dependent transcriptional regulator